jgi:hypothetical protein
MLVYQRVTSVAIYILVIYEVTLTPDQFFKKKLYKGTAGCLYPDTCHLMVLAIVAN